jgi:hypothetical protein
MFLKEPDKYLDSMREQGIVLEDTPDNPAQPQP